MATPPQSMSLRGGECARSNPLLQRKPCLIVRFCSPSSSGIGVEGDQEIFIATSPGTQ